MEENNNIFLADGDALVYLTLAYYSNQKHSKHMANFI